MNRTAPTSAFGLRIAAGLLAVGLMGFLPNAALADYLVVGAIKGQSCIYYGPFWNCTTDITIDAIEGSDGNLYKLPIQYSDVSEYDEEAGMCLIRVASRWPNPIGWLVDETVNLRYFARQPDGIYQLVDFESLLFRCEKAEEDFMP
jgi:hypothetical protein|tara:strand:- start:920 stop:1357 length:438 start_codon:yes stop_codon:yes gene_type:complete